MTEVPQTPERTPPSMNAAVIVLLVVVIGLVGGFVLALAVPSVVPPVAVCPTPPPPPAPVPVCPSNPQSSGSGYVQVSVVLSSLAVALLVSLLIVYLRTYRETKAPYIIGLVLFLLALLVQTVLTSPFVYTELGLPPGKLAPFLTIGALFMDAALAIFLYLSLQ